MQLCLRVLHNGYCPQALTLLPMEAPMRLVHYMYNGPFGRSVDVMRSAGLRNRGPRLLSTTARNTWQRCELQVVECKVRVPLTAETVACAANAGGLPTPVVWLQELPVAQGHNAWLQRLLLEGQHAGVWPSRPLDHPGNHEHCNAASASNCPPVQEVTIKLLTGRTHQVRAQLAASGNPVIGDVMYGPLTGQLVQGTGDEPASERLIQAVAECQQQNSPIGLHAASLQWQGRTFHAPAPWN